MIKNSLLLGFCAITMLLTPGCFFTRFGETIYSIGVTEYYADGSSIKDDIIYRVDDTCYIYVREIAVEYSPGWFAVAMHPLITCSRFDFRGNSGRYVLISLTSDAAKYLLAEESDKEGWLRGSWGDICIEPVDLSQAELLPVRRYFLAPMIVPDCGGEKLTEGIYVRSEKTGASWLLAPLMVVGFAVDVPVFVASAGVTIALAPVVIPIALIGKAFGM